MDKLYFRKYFCILLMFFCAICLSVGQLIWKLMPGFNLIYLFSGFVIFAAGALSMIIAYRFGELSFLQPLNSMSYIFSAIIAVFVLHENISLTNIVGIVFIVIGIIVIGVNNQ